MFCFQMHINTFLFSWFEVTMGSEGEVSVDIGEYVYVFYMCEEGCHFTTKKLNIRGTKIPEKAVSNFGTVFL